MTFNWDISLGSILSGIAIALGVWKSHTSAKSQQAKIAQELQNRTLEMHRQNREDIAGLTAQVKILVEWMQKRLS